MNTLTEPQGAEIIAALDLDKDAEKFPYCKLHVTWPDGGGETPWGRNLEGGLASMENSALYPKYRFRDILQVHGHAERIREAGEVIYRHYPTKIVFLYEAGEGEGDDPDKERRQLIIDAVNAVNGAATGVFLSFFTAGQGYVLCSREASPEAVAEALKGTGFITQGPHAENFDVAADEYDYQDL